MFDQAVFSYPLTPSTTAVIVTTTFLPALALLSATKSERFNSYLAVVLSTRLYVLPAFFSASASLTLVTVRFFKFVGFSYNVNDLSVAPSSI